MRRPEKPKETVSKPFRAPPQIRRKPTIHYYLKYTLNKHGYREETVREGQRIKPNKSFRLRKVRPASRKQQPSCEIRGTGELPFKLLLQGFLRAHFQQGTQEAIR